MIADIINLIPGIEDLSYLELGIGDGRNFDAVRSSCKTSVDINGRATYTATTDDFFDWLDTRQMFDVIFIDADHDLDHALRDFNNSVEHCRRWVLMHDMIPPSERFTQSRYCSDSYKLLYYLWSERPFDFYPMSDHFGLTFIRMPARTVWLDMQFIDLRYADFARRLGSERLYNQSEIMRIISP